MNLLRSNHTFPTPTLGINCEPFQYGQEIHLFELDDGWGMTRLSGVPVVNEDIPGLVVVPRTSWPSVSLRVTAKLFSPEGLRLVYRL
jgi:hypothetical protein